MATLNMQSRMPFGKYKDQVIQDLFDSNPDYLRWLFENTNVFFEKDVFTQIRNKFPDAKRPPQEKRNTTTIATQNETFTEEEPPF